jgi:tRNA(Phe) wybutosine-synthesizing methylase Tyw3
MYNRILAKKAKFAFFVMMAFIRHLMTFTTGNAVHMANECGFENPSI